MIVLGDTTEGHSSISAYDDDEDVISQADKDLEMLIQIACKLTQDQKSSKEKEAIIDIDQLPMSLDVPSEKKRPRRIQTMNVSLEEIKKVLQKKNEEQDSNIQVP